MRPLFHGVYPVLAIPFHDDESLDLEGLARLARYCRDSGVDGLVCGGNASEFTTLSVRERQVIAERVREAVPELPLIVGVAAPATPDSLALGEHARSVGAAAVMAMPPFPRAGTDDDLRAFYRSLATAADLPVVVQNSGPPVGIVMRPDLLVAIVEAVPAVRSIKEESADSTHKTSRLTTATRDVAVVGGQGGRYALSERARGAVGMMPASSLPEAHVALWHALEAGDERRARACFAALLPLVVMSDHLGPRLHKEVLVARGVIASAAIREQGHPAFDDIDRREMTAWLGLLDAVLQEPAADA